MDQNTQDIQCTLYIHVSNNQAFNSKLRIWYLQGDGVNTYTASNVFTV